MSARIAELQRAMSRVCFDPTPSERDLELLGMERARLYRDMVRSRLRELISVALPWTERTLGRAATTELFRAFLAEAPPRSRYFREVVPAFLAFVRPRLEGPMYPEHARDVATLEGTRWELGWREGQIEEPIGELALESVPVPSPTLRVLTLGHDLHRADPMATETPAKGTYFVCVHRRPDHVVETRTLDATGARLVRAWARADRTVIESVRDVLREEGREADPAFVERMGALLAALVESGALLGSRAC
ncbi:MAG: putative DNA-binding domain-containing protein [Myxococcota bacterium]|nr:putative DNA-binding domain-containing protein [Myxococcota bacterium]